MLPISSYRPHLQRLSSAQVHWLAPSASRYSRIAYRLSRKPAPHFRKPETRSRMFGDRLATALTPGSQRHPVRFLRKETAPGVFARPLSKKAMRKCLVAKKPPELSA